MKPVFGEDEIRSLTKDLHTVGHELDELLAAQGAKAQMRAEVIAFKKIMAHAHWLMAKIARELDGGENGIDHPTRDEVRGCIQKAHFLFQRSCELLYGRTGVGLLSSALKAKLPERSLPFHESRMANYRAVLATLPSIMTTKDGATREKADIIPPLSVKETAAPQKRAGPPPFQPPHGGAELFNQKKVSFLTRWLNPGPKIAFGERALRRYSR